MKLWKKLSLMTLLVLFAVLLLSGAAVIGRSARYNEEKTLENYEQQVRSTARALGKELDDTVLAAYSDTTRSSFYNFLLKKYGAEQYILLKGGQVLCNLTPFALSDPGNARWAQEETQGVIQKSKDRYVVIAGRSVPAKGGGDYRLVLVKDVSGVYEDIRRQTVFFAAVLLAGAAGSVLLVFFFTGRILAPLKELQHAAQDIRAGKLSRRAAVRTGDEVGIVAEAFNDMAEQIERQMTELSAVSEQRRQMLGSLAHELKTPMTSMIGYSDSLLHVKLKEEQRERALLHIHEESRRLERLTGKLMSLVGLYDNDSITLEDTDMRALFERVAGLEKFQLEERKMKLSWNCRMKNRRLDQDLFESLLMNLIDNAVKAGKEGDTIFLTGEGEIIAVEDTGRGIPQEEIARVTEAFYMVDRARGRRAGGSGLGLALCERIARLHGARLEIESEVGRGTKVSVIFSGGVYPGEQSGA